MEINIDSTYPQQVTYYHIVEDWMFDRNSGQMIIHIAGIAPAAHGIKRFFWVKYADIRIYMARYEVYNGNNKPVQNWDQYFESRQFSSKIIAVSGLDYWDKDQDVWIYSDPLGTDTPDNNRNSKKREKRHNKKK